MKIGELLVEHQYTSAERIETALRIQETTHKPIGQILVDLAFAKDEDLRYCLFLQRNINDQDIVDFLRHSKPFKGLDIQDLVIIASAMQVKDFKPGQTIIGDHNRGTDFYLIKDGLVRVYIHRENKEIVLGYLENGESFGEISLLTDVDTGSRIAAVEWTRCVVLKKEPFREMVGRHPDIKDFFINLFMRRMKNIYKELLAEAPGTSRVEPFLYRKQVNDLLTRPSISCDENESIRSVAALLMAKKVSTIIVNNATGMAGLVGLREIIKALAIDGRDLSEPVRSIIRKHYFTINGNDYIFDAIHEMMRHQTSKLVVIHKGKTKGIITGFDLLRFRGRDVLALIRNIESAPDLRALDRHRQEVENVLRALRADGAMASYACKIISVLNDKITRKVITLTENELGTAPAPYAWLGLGSEGRQEQTILTDQDNGLVFSSTPGTESTEYFRDFSARVVDALNKCGFPLCKGKIMATNRKYCGTLDSWKARAGNLISSPIRDDENLVDKYIFLDFRTIHGNGKLEKELRSHIHTCIQRNRHFLQDLADTMISIPVPLNIFKNFIVEKQGQYKNKLNFKNFGLLPLTSCLKILAFYYQMEEINSLDRLMALERRMVFSPDEAELYKNGLDTFLTLKIENNLADMNEGRDFGNHIDPNFLSNRQKQLLKEAFTATSQIQKKTREVIMTGSNGPEWKNAELARGW